MGVGLKIVHLNIRSLDKNFDEIFLFFNGYDMILLSETWLNKSHDTMLYSHTDYVLLRQDRDTKLNKRGGGLAVYVKMELSMYLHVLEEVSDVSKDVEHMWFE